MNKSFLTNLMFALRMLRRDWRAGELRVLFVALVIAVASVGSVSFFTDRVRQALTLEASRLLGADLIITADRELPPEFAAEAKARGLRTVAGVRFPSMVFANEEALLTDIKVVADGYPLRGEILLADPARPTLRSAARSVKAVPPPGSVWPDTKMAVRLKLAPGDTIAVGNAKLKVGAILFEDPEMAGGFLNIAPKLLLNRADLDATELMQPGNRASYRLMIAGKAAEAYQTWVAGKVGPGQRVENIRDLRPEIKSALERAERFLGLASLVAVMLAAVAVALAARRYLQRHLDAAAVMRCMGAPQRQTLQLYLWQFLVLGVTAGIAGILLALAGQQVLVSLLGFLVSAELPPPSWLPAVQAASAALLLLFGFALPPLLALSKTPPLRVLRRDLGLPSAGGWLAYLLGLAVVGGLVFWQAGDVKIGGYMLAGISGLLVVSVVVAWALLRLVRLVPQRGYGWRYGLANLRRRPLASSLQIGTLGLGIMALLLLTLVRTDLLASWRNNLPPDAPNRFVINIQPEQVEPMTAFFAANQLKAPVFSPMVRGRLVELNGTKISSNDYTDDRAKRLINREFNLSWARDLPSGNRLTSGKWYGADARSEVSMEEGIAETLKLKIGDRLVYDIAGSRVEVTVTSLRKVDWDSFQVNFFAVMPKVTLEGLPSSYITAFRLPGEDSDVTARLVREFPNALVIDVGEIMVQVQRIMDEVSKAVEFVFFFTLLAGLLVLQAAIATTQDERQYDAAVLRTLGASRRQLRTAQIAEFLVLGALAGLLAAGGATALSWVLATKAFQVPYSFNFAIWVVGLVGGGLGVAITGWWGTRSTLNTPPLATIRALA